MPGFRTIQDLFDRLGAYPLWQVVVELAVIWLFVYMVWRFVQGTRAARALTGIVVLVLLTVLLRLFTPVQSFERLAYLYDRLLGFVALALIIVFQPELRRALIRLGEAPFFFASSGSVASVVEPLVAASTFLSKNKFGAIMAIERQVGLRETAETGKILNAELSAELLESIFWPSNPLHDMGVIIRGDRIVAAGAQFPLAEPHEVSDPTLGTRHRAAIGLTRSTDALVIVVSEETGAISLAERGKLQRWLTPEALRAELTSRLSPSRIAVQAAEEQARETGALSDEGIDEKPTDDSDNEEQAA